MIEEAESLGTDLSTTETALLARAQAQADQVAALSTQRSELSADISTEASDATAELNDLNSEISTFDSVLEGEIVSNAASVDARSGANTRVISAMPTAISALSGSVSTHEAALETAGDSLEAKIDARLSNAATVRLSVFVCHNAD